MRGPIRRSRRSSVDRLDPEIKELIAKLRIDHGWTIDEILQKLRELGQTDISRSALGRHTKTLEEIGAQLRHSREVAKALIDQVGDAPEDRTAELNIELMHSMILRLVTATQSGEDGPQPVSFDPEDTMFLAKSLQSLASARKTDVDRVLKVRAETLKTAAARVEEAGKAKGMSADTVAFITRAVLGSDG